MPRFFAYDLYEAHRTGTSIDVLAEELDVTSAWVEERLEAVRLCLQFQMPMLKAVARGAGLISQPGG